VICSRGPRRATSPARSAAAAHAAVPALPPAPGRYRQGSGPTRPTQDPARQPQQRAGKRCHSPPPSRCYLDAPPGAVDIGTGAEPPARCLTMTAPLYPGDPVHNAQRGAWRHSSLDGRLWLPWLSSPGGDRSVRAGQAQNMKDQRQMRAARRTVIKQRLAATDTRIGEPNRLSRQITILLWRPGGWPWRMASGAGKRSRLPCSARGPRGESALDGRDSLGGRDDFPQLRRRQVLPSRRRTSVLPPLAPRLPGRGGGDRRRPRAGNRPVHPAGSAGTSRRHDRRNCGLWPGTPRDRQQPRAGVSVVRRPWRQPSR